MERVKILKAMSRRYKLLYRARPYCFPGYKGVTLTLDERARLFDLTVEILLKNAIQKNQDCFLVDIVEKILKSENHDVQDHPKRHHTTKLSTNTSDSEKDLENRKESFTYLKKGIATSKLSSVNSQHPLIHKSTKFMSIPTQFQNILSHKHENELYFQKHTDKTSQVSLENYQHPLIRKSTKFMSIPTQIIRKKRKCTKKIEEDLQDDIMPYETYLEKGIDKISKLMDPNIFDRTITILSVVSKDNPKIESERNQNEIIQPLEKNFEKRNESFTHLNKGIATSELSSVNSQHPVIRKSAKFMSIPTDFQNNSNQNQENDLNFLKNINKTSQVSSENTNHQIIRKTTKFIKNREEDLQEDIMPYETYLEKGFDKISKLMDPNIFDRTIKNYSVISQDNSQIESRKFSNEIILPKLNTPEQIPSYEKLIDKRKFIEWWLETSCPEEEPTTSCAPNIFKNIKRWFKSRDN